MKAETERALFGSRGAPAWAPGLPPFPASTLTSDAVYAADLARVFGRAWLPLAHTSELGAPGAWSTRAIGRWRLVIVRSETGVGVFHNVCRHRGALVARGACGQHPALTCPYHGFTYDLDGRLIGMREPASYDLRREDHGLKAVHSEVRYGVVWARLSAEGPDLDTFLGPELIDHLQNWPLADLVVHATITRPIAASWRVCNDGFLETLHLPSIHKSTINQLVSVRQGSALPLGDHSLMFSPFRLPDLYEADGALGRHAAAAGVLPFAGLNAFQRQHGLVYHLFPTTTLNLLPNHITFAQFWPVDRQRSEVRMWILGAPATTDAARAWFASLVPGFEKLVAEDDAVLSEVQQGLETGALDDMPLSSWEGRIHHFRARLEAWHR